MKLCNPSVSVGRRRPSSTCVRPERHLSGYFPSEVPRVMHPAVTPSVTARWTSPHEVVQPFSVFVSVRAERRIGLSRPSSTLVLTEPGSWRVLRRRAVMPFQARSHPLLGFHSSSGYCRSPPQRRERPRDRPFRVDAVPLMGFCSLQRTPARRIQWSGVPSPGTLRLQSSNLSWRLDPLRASRPFLVGSLMGFHLQGLAPPGDSRFLWEPRALLALSIPTYAR